MSSHSVFLVLTHIQAWEDPCGTLRHLQVSRNRCRKVKEIENWTVCNFLNWKRTGFSPNRKNLQEFLEKKADRAFQGEFAAQTRLSEAQAELDRKEWLRRSADIALCETGRQLESQRVGNFIKQINCLIRLKGRRAGQVKNYR